MDLVFLEVDGSLENTYAAASVLLWAVLLCCFGILGVCGRCPRTIRWTGAALGLILAARTRNGQQLIGSMLYSATSAGWVDVGFWDGPSTSVAPTIAVIATITAWMWDRRSKLG
jgi:hypothetical protein